MTKGKVITQNSNSTSPVKNNLQNSIEDKGNVSVENTDADASDSDCQRPKKKKKKKKDWNRKKALNYVCTVCKTFFASSNFKHIPSICNMVSLSREMLYVM